MYGGTYILFPVFPSTPEFCTILCAAILFVWFHIIYVVIKCDSFVEARQHFSKADLILCDETSCLTPSSSSSRDGAAATRSDEHTRKTRKSSHSAVAAVGDKSRRRSSKSTATSRSEGAEKRSTLKSDDANTKSSNKSWSMRRKSKPDTLSPDNNAATTSSERSRRRKSSPDTSSRSRRRSRSRSRSRQQRSTTMSRSAGGAPTISRRRSIDMSRRLLPEVVDYLTQSADDVSERIPMLCAFCVARFYINIRVLCSTFFFLHSGRTH